MNSVYENEEFVSRTTAEFIRRGFPILQSHKLAATDAAHVARLLEYMSPPANASILDAGCGVGAVAEIMSELRPDLRFTLLNISPSQLGFAPDFPKIHADFHHIPREDASFDVVMFNFALGHGDLEKCVTEASRVLRLGGILFLYELTADDADQYYVFERVGYKPHSLSDLKKVSLPFSPRQFFEPPTTIHDFVSLLGVGVVAGYGFDRMRPIVCRFVK